MASVRVGESVGKVSGNVGVYGWLDRHRRVLEVLEESIEYAGREAQSKSGRGHDDKSRLEWCKTLIRLLELYDSQLETIKRHIYGNSMPGARIEEPGESTNGLVEFERKFQNNVQKPWEPKDLKLECEDCGRLSEEVSERDIPGEWVIPNLTRSHEYLDLCHACYEKRMATADSP